MLHNHGKYTHKPTLGNYLISQKYGPPLQDSCLENPMDGGVWWAAVQGVAKSRAWLSDFSFTFHLHALEKEMATHSSVLAWRIPGMGEPYGLPSMGSHRVGHDWSDLATLKKCYGYWKRYLKLCLTQKKQSFLFVCFKFCSVLLG